MKRALLSVSDKTGLLELARELIKLDYELVSTGGTASLLQKNKLPVRQVVDVTGFPECLDGRLKTLHPKIHGGILAVRDKAEHMQALEELEIKPIDLLVINLYPFLETISRPGVSQAECIENIDIGGPALLRAGAKNHAAVTVLSDPADYGLVIEQLQKDGQTDLATRQQLAGKAFAHTAAYDAVISGFFAKINQQADWPEQLTLTYTLKNSLRYGENPQQQAAFYADALPAPGSLTAARQLNGKELSYNNIADTDAALALLKEFSEPTVVAIKHANPCGVGSAADLLTAWQKAYAADPVSIFGGIVAYNRTVDLAIAQASKGVFIEVMLAPAYTDEALAHLQERKNLRVLVLPDLLEQDESRPALKAVYGGLLVQGQNTTLLGEQGYQPVTKKQVDPDLAADLEFALKVVKHVKSNAIVLVKNGQTVGIGPGQPNRITSVEIALKRAGEKAAGAVLASDAFFPFADWVPAAAKAGLAAVVQPGGSVRDQESIAACDEAGLAMVFTGMRHFCH